MIPEAEAFVQADQAAVGLVAQILAAEWELLLPPVFDMPGADRPTPLRQVVSRLAYDDAWVPDMLAGRTMEEVGRDAYAGDLLGDDPAAALARIAAAAQRAAGQVTDRDAAVHCSYGDAPVWDYFWQLVVARTLAAHDTALLLGRPSPLTEELARRAWEGVQPMAEVWRGIGVFRDPVAVDDDAGWVERYLALTGRAAGAAVSPRAAGSAG
ncbi:TIGR03086 family protein [Motilibacter deserti]|uniref:TIGR03086 family protein n=1 Tax=Motilibacter deserti TaxID=2714956 RepID=A0ABX0GS44_9ACTN|nr:TIGR03086 family protein [Motilibacter deserti]NHC13313.1 TIGR03086 family protein [Motilibacter deserti]